MELVVDRIPHHRELGTKIELSMKCATKKENNSYNEIWKRRGESLNASEKGPREKNKGRVGRLKNDGRFEERRKRAIPSTSKSEEARVRAYNRRTAD